MLLNKRVICKLRNCVSTCPHVLISAAVQGLPHWAPSNHKALVLPGDGQAGGDSLHLSTLCPKSFQPPLLLGRCWRHKNELHHPCHGLKACSWNLANTLWVLTLQTFAIGCPPTQALALSHILTGCCLKSLGMAEMQFLAATRYSEKSTPKMWPGHACESLTHTLGV